MRSDAKADLEAQFAELAELTPPTPFFPWMDADLNLRAGGAGMDTAEWDNALVE